LLVYGQVEVTVPQVGSEQSAFSQAAATANPGICPSSGSTSSNQWSVQDNVNGWTITSGPNAGDTAWVQFTIQSNGSTNAICIWNIDLTSQTYPNKCYAPPNPPSIQRSGGLQAFDFGNIAATTSPVTFRIGATLTETNGSGTVMVQNGGSCVNSRLRWSSSRNEGHALTGWWPLDRRSRSAAGSGAERSIIPQHRPGPLRSGQRISPSLICRPRNECGVSALRALHSIIFRKLRQWAFGSIHLPSTLLTAPRLFIV
jgi:hypothetical protein